MIIMRWKLRVNMVCWKPTVNGTTLINGIIFGMFQCHIGLLEGFHVSSVEVSKKSGLKSLQEIWHCEVVRAGIYRITWTEPAKSVDLANTAGGSVVIPSPDEIHATPKTKSRLCLRAIRCYIGYICIIYIYTGSCFGTFFFVLYVGNFIIPTDFH